MLTWVTSDETDDDNKRGYDVGLEQCGGVQMLLVGIEQNLIVVQSQGELRPV